jgi:hypothetical protein
MLVQMAVAFEVRHPAVRSVDPELGDGPAGDLVGDPTGRRPAAGGQNFGVSSSAL